MGRNQQPSAADAAALPPLGADPDSPLGRFSRELAQRFPHRLVKRFAMPSRVRQCREVFLLELTSRDEVQAAIMADTMMSAIEKGSYKLAAEAERRECIRLAIVGLGKLATDGEVVYSHANHDGIPLAEINEWGMAAWTALQTYFGQVNGVPNDELAEGLLGAQTVGAFAPPTSGTPASAANGKLAAASGPSTSG